MNNQLIFKISRIASIVIMALGALFIVLVWNKGDDAIREAGAQGGLLSSFFLLAIITLVLTAILAVGFPLVQSFSNPKQAIRVLIVVGLFVVLFGISWLIASDNVSSEMVAQAVEDGRISTGGIRRVGAGLIATYILVGAAIIATIYSSVSKLLK